DSRGHLWLAVFRGAVIFSDPDRLPMPRLPQPVLDGVRIDGRALPLTGPIPHVPLGHGLFDARFTAALFEGREHLAFRYRLDGVDREWRDAGDRQEVVYAGLGPGTYRFRVVPSFPDGPEFVTIPEATLAFVLIPPFHRTGAFYALMGVLFVLAATGAVLMRLRVIRRRLAIIAEERDRIAREIHDSLEQTLYAAQMQIDAAGEDPMPPETASNLARARELIARGIEETRASVWALRTGIFGRAELSIAISVTAGETLRGSNISFDLSSTGQPYRLPAITEWHIGQALREAFTNALKHAKAKILRVHLAFEPSKVIISIADDGAGFDVGGPNASRPGHYGLRGMRERLRAFGGGVTIESAPGRGTTVRIEVPRPGVDKS
ncbi:MAG TPA: histidine kinase, partial [Polyangia bacterium]